MQDLDLLDGRLRVSNMPGAGGGVAFAHVVTERQNENGLLVAASSGTTLRLAQGQYGEFKADDVRWLGAISVDYGMIAVAQSSPFQSLDDVIEAWRKDPASAVLGGGSAVGGQDHLMSLLLAKEAGIDPLKLRYVSFDGGGEALSAALGGHIAILSSDVSSNRAQVEAGTVRGLAVLAPERLEGDMAIIPTAKELGYDVEWPTFRGFFGPAGMSEDAANSWEQKLKQVEASDAWVDVRTQLGLQPYALIGDPFQQFVTQQIDELQALTQSMGLSN